MFLSWHTCYVVRGRALCICQGGATTSLRCGSVCGGGVREVTMPLAWLYPAFRNLPHHPQANWALLGLIPRWVVCVHSRTLWVSPANSFMRLGVSPAATPPQIFTARGFEALFPHTGTLGCMVCVTPQLFIPVYLHANVVLPSPVLQLLPCRRHPLCSPVWMNASSLIPWLSDFHTV